MAGIFGNSFEDRHFERQLDNYLNSLDQMRCPSCETEGMIDDFIVEETDTKYKYQCPWCEHEWEEFI